MDYQAYLRSDWWKRRRKRALVMAEFKCQVCNSPHQLEVHHRTYTNLGKEEDPDLTVLCGECHSLFHEHRRLHRGSS